jgi:D-beta-D-heptose 7-phosphate kinase/D-beta-D-heptose 1-phosphate adenosyltransferase
MFEHLTAENNPFTGKNIAIVGDVMLDTFIYGSVERISPEAPVPVVSVTKQTNTFGGAGNVAMNLKALGLEPLMVGRVGNDDACDTLKKMAKEFGITTEYLVKAKTPTIRKTRIVSQGQQIVRIDDEKIESLTDITRAEVIKHLKEIHKNTDIIIVSDYAKGGIDQQMLEDIKQIWGATGTVLVDPKPRKSIDYTGVTSMTPNLKESLELLADEGRVVTSDNDAGEVACSLAEKFGLKSMLMTRAGDGMTLFDQGKVKHHKPASTLEVRDVSGAGDTVISALAAGLAVDMPMNDAVELANICGGLVVAKTGTATVSWAEVVEGIKNTGKYPPYVFR